ncbi:MAG: DUF4340 domain-containing protein [Saprospiraceae bacterium]
MRNTIILLVLFLLLGGGTYWFLTQNQDKTPTSMVGQDRLFKVKDVENITKIFIADRAGNTTTLTRKNAEDWIYADKYPARPGAIRNLLDAVQKIEMKYKPAEAAVKGMVADLATNGIKVEIYKKGTQPVKTYYIGGSTSDERGTYGIMEGSDQPYVVNIPSWEGNIRFRYSLLGDDWRDRAVFAEEVEDIQTVSVEYPLQKNKSFKLERTGKYDFKVEPFYELTTPINREVNQGKVEAYLTGFKNIGAEDFKNEVPIQDSIRQLQPFVIISLTNKNAETRSARFFPILQDYHLYDEDNNAYYDKKKIVERYHVDVSNGDFMMVQNLVFQKLFWQYPNFFEQPKRVLN